MEEKKVCQWAENSSGIYRQYHDQEWGVPVHDDQLLFEFLILEGAQAGLSWSTILNKRESYRAAFDHFDFHQVANYEESKLTELLQNRGIVRNKLKINAAVSNARAFLVIREECGSFDQYLWEFVDNKTIVGHWETASEVPVTTKESDLLSKDLKKRGFKFVGSTIIYAFMQAVGMVNDHTTDCFRYQELTQ